MKLASASLGQMSALLIAMAALAQPAQPPLTPHKSKGVVGVGSVSTWRMSDMQRISLRVAAEKRGPGDQPTYSESIDGRDHPELFLPMELFDHLLYGLSPDSRRAREAHALWDSKVALFGYDVTQFWSSLQSVSQPYVDLSTEKRRGRASAFVLKGTDGKQTLIQINRDVCAARIAALQRARSVFGADDFDRFLYTIVAPDVSIATSGPGENRRVELQFTAGGCK